MHKVDYRDLDKTPEAVAAALSTASANAVHLAARLRAEPYPADCRTVTARPPDDPAVFSSAGSSAMPRSRAGLGPADLATVRACSTASWTSG